MSIYKAATPLFTSASPVPRIQMHLHLSVELFGGQAFHSSTPISLLHVLMDFFGSCDSPCLVYS